MRNFSRIDRGELLVIIHQVFGGKGGRGFPGKQQDAHAQARMGMVMTGCNGWSRFAYRRTILL